MKLLVLANRRDLHCYVQNVFVRRISPFNQQVWFFYRKHGNTAPLSNPEEMGNCLYSKKSYCYFGFLKHCDYLHFSSVHTMLRFIRYRWHTWGKGKKKKSWYCYETIKCALKKPTHTNQVTTPHAQEYFLSSYTKPFSRRPRKIISKYFYLCSNSMNILFIF